MKNSVSKAGAISQYSKFIKNDPNSDDFESIENSTRDDHQNSSISMVFNHQIGLI